MSLKCKHAMRRFDCCCPLLAAAALVASAPGAVSAGSPADAIRSVSGTPALAAADTTPPARIEQASGSGEGAGDVESDPSPADGEASGELRPATGLLVPTGTSAMEGAWGADGDPGVLHVVAVGLEAHPLPTLTIRVEWQAKWGHDGVPFPSSQGLSSLDADDFGGPGEAWVEWRPADVLRLKAGRVDGNTEFAAAEAAALFANPSFGLSPALGLIPSYPAPAPALNLFVRPARDGPEVGAGVYRAAGGAWTAVGQVAGPVGRLPVRWAAGVAAPLWSGAGPDHPTAGYLILETGTAGSLGVFGKVAAAGELLHLAGGVTAPLPVFDSRVGIAGSLVSAPEYPTGEEVVAEAFVAVRPLPWLVVQPDVQLRLAPGTSPRAGALLRVIVEC